MKPDKDGVSLYSHLEQVERQTGISPKALDGPVFPLELGYLWSAFFSLNNARQSGFSGPQPISYTEILAWMQTTNQPLNAREVDVIKVLDTIFIRTMTKDG